MKTAMGTEKVRVWISETVGTKIATRLFRGLALGALLVAATGLYFSIDQGEAGSPPSGSETTQVFEVEELEAPVIGVPAYLSLDAYEADEMGMWTNLMGRPARPLTNEEIESQAEVDHLVILEEVLFAELSKNLFGTSRRPTSEEIESQAELERLLALEWAFDVEELEAPIIGVPASSSSETTQAFEALAYWAERDEVEEMLFAKLRQTFIGIPASSEQIQCYPEDVILGWCYGFADAPHPALTTDATISGIQILPEDAWRFDSPYYDDFLADAAASRPSIDLNEVWTEIEDTPVHHLMKQLKAGSPRVTKQTECYPELDIC